MTLKIYEYNRCSTCKKALKYLDERNISFETIAIREQAPSISELEFMLSKTGNIKKLLNSSGQDYRALNMKEKIKTMSEKEIFELLTENGNLVKRPFVLDRSSNIGITGFKSDDWDQLF